MKTKRKIISGITLLLVCVILICGSSASQEENRPVEARETRVDNRMEVEAKDLELNFALRCKVLRVERYIFQNPLKLHPVYFLLLLAIVLLTGYSFRINKKKNKSQISMPEKTAIEDQEKTAPETPDTFHIPENNPEEFISTLISLYPDLSESDLEFCQYYKDGLDNNDIVEKTGLKKEVVRKRKSRLKEKLGLKDSAIDIEDFLSNL